MVIVVFSAITLGVNYFIYNQVAQSLIDADNRERLNEAQQILDKMNGDPTVIPLPAEGAFVRILLQNQLEVTEIFSSTDFPDVDMGINLIEMEELLGFKIATVYQTLNDYDDSVIELSVARENSELTVQLTQIKQYLFLANFMAIAISGVLSLIFTSLFLKPIKNIIQTTASIQASKNMDRLEEPKTNDEIQKLAETINIMLQRIEDDINNQTNFFNSASHELRTPLTVMQTELSLALNKANDPEHRELIESQMLEVGRLTRIIKDFLLIGQLKGNLLHINKTMGSMDEIIYAALKKIQLLVASEHKSVKFNIGADIDDLAINCDIDKTENVLINLFENGIKYSSEGSTLDIDLQKSSETYQICISNQIEHEVPDISLLATEYHRTDHRTSGMGLGLWICSNIVKLHEGDIKFSQSENGFKVRLTLPVAVG